MTNFFTAYHPYILALTLIMFFAVVNFWPTPISIFFDLGNTLGRINFTILIFSITAVNQVYRYFGQKKIRENMFLPGEKVFFTYSFMTLTLILGRTLVDVYLTDKRIIYYEYGYLTVGKLTSINYSNITSFDFAERTFFQFRFLLPSLMPKAKIGVLKIETKEKVYFFKPVVLCSENNFELLGKIEQSLKDYR